MGNEPDGNTGNDEKFDCYTVGGSGTGTGTRYYTGHVEYDQCHFEIPKETIINLEKTIENYKNEIKILLNEKQKEEENKKKLKGKNIINEKSNNLINEEIRKLKKEKTELKFLNEKYKNLIKDKDNIIFKLKEDIKYYIKEKNNADKKIIEINNIHQI